MINKEPYLSILTITLNDFKGLKKTFRSLKDILHKDIEWIIKDGGSKKSELNLINILLKEIIDEHPILKKKIIFNTHKDNGIYQAMNYCLSKANGKWIIFMNGGDEFASSKSFYESLKNFDSKNYQIIIGSTYVMDKGKRFISKSRNIKLCLGINSYRMPAMHQSQIYNKKIYKKIMFREEYKYSGDHVFFWDAFNKLKNKSLIYNYQNVIAIFYNDGISSRNPLNSLREVFKSMIKIQKIPYLIAFFAALKRLLAILYFLIRNKISKGIISKDFNK